jgi:putative ABC transport system ATP-binding protein
MPTPRLPSTEGPGIELRNVVKTYVTGGGTFTALRGINLQTSPGEFVGIIGKSGSGKTTLISMITAIDRPTSGEVLIGETAVHTLSEGQAAVWRGGALGIVFQFFQLLPALSLLQNVMLPMDFCGIIPRRQRKQRAMTLLDRVGLVDQAHKLPSAVSGGQQQRAAIARALANDPPILIADEPTGNLDSRTAESVFGLFEELVREGKTVVMVTHDNDLARRVNRVAMVVDGDVVNQYVVSALPTLNLDGLSFAQSRFVPITIPAGAIVIRQGDEADRFYIITSGQAEVLLEHPGGQEILVDTLGPGRYFGEIALLQGGRRTATVRASAAGPVEAVTLDGPAFEAVIGASEATREEMASTIQERLAGLRALQ